MRLVLVDTSEGALLRMVGARTYNLRGGVQLDERVKSLDCPPGVETILGLVGNLGLEVGCVLWARCHLVLLFLGRELSRFLFTLESPPKRVFPLWFLRTLSA